MIIYLFHDFTRHAQIIGDLAPVDKLIKAGLQLADL
jgi:hypothetical protein